jgi:hypothetical protein
LYGDRRTTYALRQHLRAVDERLGALEVLLERDLALDERIYAVLDVKPTGGEPSDTTRNPRPAPAPRRSNAGRERD